MLLDIKVITMLAYFAQIRHNALQIQPQQVSTPVPGPQQLLVRVRAAGLNRGEILALHHSAPQQPKPLGAEAAGEILQLGPDCAGFNPGDRVMGRCHGAFADAVLMDVQDAMKVPDTLSWVQAGALPISTQVVHDMLIGQGHLAAGEWLLITGVASGVGVAALQLAKSLGARVIGTSGSSDKLAALQPLGLDLGIATRRTDFDDTVLAATDGQGVNLVVNIVGASMLPTCIRALAFQGRLAMVGYMDDEHEATLDIRAVHSQRLHLFGVSSKRLSPSQRHRIVQGVVDDILPRMADPAMQPLIDRVYPMSQLAEALERMEANAQVGKIVMRGLD
ncbi:zinc-binding dehydrogenase [Castellaniella sp.]|uniref:zinc-binding dehydrogenase n=1 Tax=Castellaniella sp. TaxID=1955812 RepID=UPI003A8EAF19